MSSPYTDSSPSGLARIPQIRPEHAPYRVRGDKIRIGGTVAGIAAEIADPRGWVQTLMLAFDGSHAIEGVLCQLAQHHPNVPKEEVLQAIKNLSHASYIDDAAGGDSDHLNPNEKERYKRAMEFYRRVDLSLMASSRDPQVRVRNARVLVVGLGGSGACGK